jgi:hypothetical protein
VLCEDNHTYTIFYDDRQDQWYIVL